VLSEEVKTYLMFHMCCTAIQVSHMDDIPKREALERIQEMGSGYAVDTLIECGTHERFRERSDWKHRQWIAGEVRANREEAMEYIAGLIQRTIDVLPKP
jgi:hypothetical protein